MPMPEAFILMALYALNTMPSAFQKAAPTANPHFVLKIPVPAQRFCMPIMPPGKSQQKWVWSMQLKLLKKMASPLSALAEWGTAEPFLTLCSKPPAQA